MVLPDAEMNEFVDTFCNNRYDIITLVPSTDNLPESMIENYKSAATHQKILGDPQAYFMVYAIKYANLKGDIIIFPIGIFGVSEARKIRFPLLVNGFWQAILMASKEAFSQFCNKDLDFYYSRFVELKRQFMFNVFGYFKTIDNEYNSVMAWPSRGEKSNTRNVAEKLSFRRFEEGKMDIYSTADVKDAKLNYLSDCVLRWGILIDDRAQYTANVIYPAARIAMLIRGLVGIREEAVPESLVLETVDTPV